MELPLTSSPRGAALSGQVHDGARQGARDAGDALDLGDDQLSELIHGWCLTANDHVVGPVTSSACVTPAMPRISSATLDAEPTSVWIGM